MESWSSSTVEILRQCGVLSREHVVAPKATHGRHESCPESNYLGSAQTPTSGKIALVSAHRKQHLLQTHAKEDELGPILYEYHLTSAYCPSSELQALWMAS